jgi:hypothetical protein
MRKSESGPQRAVADEPGRSRRWVCKEGGKNVGVLDGYVTVAEEQVSRNAERWLLCSQTAAEKTEGARWGNYNPGGSCRRKQEAT